MSTCIQPPIPEIIPDQDDERYPSDSPGIALDEDPFGSPTSLPTSSPGGHATGSSVLSTEPIPRRTEPERVPFRTGTDERNRRNAGDGSIEALSVPCGDEEMTRKEKHILVAYVDPLGSSYCRGGSVQTVASETSADDFSGRQVLACATVAGASGQSSISIEDRNEIMSILTEGQATRLKLVNQYLAKSDGKDKLCATIQYACLFASAGSPGKLQLIQASVTKARKVFRILKPLQQLTPLLANEPSKLPWPCFLVNRLKSVLMALYFGFDHVIWASQAGIYTDKQGIESAKKISLYSWFGGSICTIVEDLAVISNAIQKVELLERGSQERKKAIEDAVHTIEARRLTLLHAGLQSLLALGLMEKSVFKGRKRLVGFVGLAASALNCYMMFPPYPRPEKLSENEKLA